jgi:hypothetical protein
VAAITHTPNVKMSTAPPVAVVMGSSSTPVVYMPTNASNMLKGSSDSGGSSPVSNLMSVASVSILVPNLTLKVSEPSTLFTVPHLFWRCTVSASTGNLPITFDALLDHGSHAVLISEQFAQTLELKRRNLHNPLTVQMAFPEETTKRIVTLSEYVKLKLYDPVGNWAAKTVHAIIAPSLCTPVILGLPFLMHNKIVVDCEL